MTDFQNDSYQIVNYLKEHTAVFIALISASVATITAILNFCSSLIQKQYFEYWNIPLEFIENTSQNYFYQFCASVALSTLAYFTMILMSTFFDEYFNYKSPKIQEDLAFKMLKKELRNLRIRSKILNMELKILAILQKFGFRNINIEKLKNKNQKICNELNANSEKIEKFAQVGAVHYSKSNFVLLLIRLFLLTVVFFGISIICSIMLYNSEMFFYHALILTLVMVVIYSVGGYLHAMIKINKKRMKSIIRKYLSGEGEWSFSKYDSPKKRTFKSYFSDTSIKNNGILIAIVMSMLLVANVCLTQFQFDNEKFFHITVQNEETYAIIYKSDDEFFLEKAEITEDKILIDVSKQLILKADEISIERMSFESVERMNNGD